MGDAKAKPVIDGSSNCSTVVLLTSTRRPSHSGVKWPKSTPEAANHCRLRVFWMLPWLPERGTQKSTDMGDAQAPGPGV